MVLYFRNQQRRITPADAGKTGLLYAIAEGLKDHPRGCGENASEDLDELAIAGSPPRMRGKLWCMSTSSYVRRITPADAGKTLVHVNIKLCPQDHPRGCGENCQKRLFGWSDCGSPPRMRGKRILPIMSSVLLRITPADAGKTKNLALVKLDSWDHPRGCGENIAISVMRLNQKGSPPRMRGKRPIQNSADLERRITPADAGKTRIGASPDRAKRDHPRGCGENV